MKMEYQLDLRFQSVVLLALVLVGMLRDTCSADNKELWIYCPANFLVESECQRVHKVMERAAKAGYTHVLVSDSKFSRLKEMDKRYFKHIEELKAKAAQLNLVLVPTSCPVGYSNDILALDPNLAEALPVKRSIYRVEAIARFMSLIQTLHYRIQRPQEMGLYRRNLCCI